MLIAIISGYTSMLLETREIYNISDCRWSIICSVKTFLGAMGKG